MFYTVVIGEPGARTEIGPFKTLADADQWASSRTDAIVCGNYGYEPGQHGKLIAPEDYHDRQP